MTRHFSHIGISSETLYIGNDLQLNTLTDRYTYLFGGGYCEFKPEVANADSIQYFYYTKDHLGNIRNVLTKNDNGQMEELQQTHYYPFGGIIADLSSGRDVQNHLYNGKELDTSNNLWWYDYGARQYDPTAPRFTTPDPLAEKYYPWNYYAYCVNNPIKYIDPDGRKGILVHGTWSSNETWSQGGQVDINFAIQNMFNDNGLYTEFNWNGRNTKEGRKEGASELISKILELMDSGEISDNEPITIIGHSHGGNVGIEAINQMVQMPEFEGRDINLLTINTPVRDDYQLSKVASDIVDHVNVYDARDLVQYWGGHHTDIGYLGQIKELEWGRAGRRFSTAINIAVDSPQSIFKDFHNSKNRTQDWVYKTRNWEFIKTPTAWRIGYTK